MLYLGVNGYADYDGKITEKYKADKEANDFAPLPPQLEELAPAIHKLIQGIFDEEVLKMLRRPKEAVESGDVPLGINREKGGRT